jgi:hypothetical protein
VLDAIWDQETVHSPNLATEQRWPRWAPQVVDELGVASMLSFQLYTREPGPSDRVATLVGWASRACCKPTVYCANRHHSVQIRCAEGGLLRLSWSSLASTSGMSGRL